MTLGYGHTTFYSIICKTCVLNVAAILNEADCGYRSMMQFCSSGQVRSQWFSNISVRSTSCLVGGSSPTCTDLSLWQPAGSCDRAWPLSPGMCWCRWDQWQLINTVDSGPVGVSAGWSEQRLIRSGCWPLGLVHTVLAFSDYANVLFLVLQSCLHRNGIYERNFGKDPEWEHLKVPPFFFSSRPKHNFWKTRTS